LQPGVRNDRLRAAIGDCTPAGCIADSATWSAVAATPAASGLRAALVLGVADRGRVNPAVGSRDSGEAHTSQVACSLQDFHVALESASAHEAAAVDTDDLAAIIYTSGTTGAPRGVMLSHGNIRANTESIVEYLSLTSRDRVMVVLPFYYVYGLSLLHTHIAVGGSLVIENRSAFPNVVLKGMQEHEVTGLAGVPSTFAMFLHRSMLRSASFPALRYVTQAGGHMPPALVREWLAALPGVPLFVMYGATEAAARLAFLPPAELSRRLGSIGRAIPGVDLRVLLEDGRQAATGEVGEIVARGANISRGYWNWPEETRARFGADGFRTGDLGFADVDGYIYLVGRRHEMIKVGAHRVSAKEIEEALHEFPAVDEAAVVPAPHDLLGEVPIAYIVLREGGHASEGDIVAFCRRTLAEHKVPARIVFRSELPKSGAGKIDKTTLRHGSAAELFEWRS
jgi:acyl-CoA synthetase (AMP-forming)/AMP-acid ligase II